MKKIIAKNTFYQLLGKVISVVAALIGLNLLTGAYGEVFVGKYTLVITYVTIFFIISDWGVNAIVVRKYSAENRIFSAHFTKVLTSKFIFAILLTLTAWGIFNLLGYEAEVVNALIYALPVITAFSLWSSASIVFQAKLRYSLDLITKIIYSTVSVGLLYLVIARGGDLNDVIFASAAGWVSMGVVSLFLVRKYIDFSQIYKVDFPFFKTLMISSYSIGISLVLNTVLTQVDRILLSKLSDFANVGIYGVSYKIFEVALVLPTFLMNAVFPVLVASKAKGEARNVSKAALDALLFFAIPITIGGIVLAPDIISVFTSGDWSSAVLPLRILMVFVCVFFATALLRWLVIAENNEKVLIGVYGKALLINVILNVLFIPQYGYIAAAVATGIAEIFVLISLLFYLPRKYFSSSSLLFGNKVFLASILSFLPVYIYYDTRLEIKLLVAGFLFLFFGFSLGIFSDLKKLSILNYVDDQGK